MNYWDEDLETYLTGVRERLRHEHEAAVSAWRARLDWMARRAAEALFMGGVFVYTLTLLVAPLFFTWGVGWVLMMDMMVWVPAYVLGLVWVMHAVAVGPPRSIRYSARMLWRNFWRWGTLDQWHH